HLAGIVAVVAVVLEQVRVRRGVEQVVDRDNLDIVAVAIEERLEDLSADAAKAIDAYTYCHWRLPSEVTKSRIAKSRVSRSTSAKHSAPRVMRHDSRPGTRRGRRSAPMRRAVLRCVVTGCIC